MMVCVFVCDPNLLLLDRILVSGPLLPLHLIPDHLKNIEPVIENPPQSSSQPRNSSIYPSKPIVGILKTPKGPNNRPRSYSGSGAEMTESGKRRRRVVFDRLALFLDAALEGDLQLVEQLYGQVGLVNKIIEFHLRV